MSFVILRVNFCLLVAQIEVKKSVLHPWKWYDKNLLVSLLPPQFLPNIQGKTEMNKVIVKHFGPTCTSDKLNEYFKTKSNFPIVKVEYSIFPGTALITFGGIPGTVYELTWLIYNKL